MAVVSAIAASLYPVVGMGGQVEGHETNVVVLDCGIEMDDKPHDIYMYAVSRNSTSNPLPTVSE